MLARVVCGIVFFLFGFNALKSQPDVKDFKDRFQIHIKEIKDPIQVDGRLEEEGLDAQRGWQEKASEKCRTMAGARSSNFFARDALSSC